MGAVDMLEPLVSYAEISLSSGGGEMDLTPENKAIIDAKSHRDLLGMIRFSPTGDPWFQGETGDYILKRRAELRDKDPD
jgi:hypothetical protein